MEARFRARISALRVTGASSKADCVVETVPRAMSGEGRGDPIGRE
jgi:hypothetical protein